MIAGVIFLACYGAAALYMTLAQRSFVYHRAPAWLEPKDYGLPQAEAANQTMADGATLRGWRIIPTRDDAPIYLYFHGNADGLNERATRFAYLASTGAGVLAFSYRGYGGSGGTPTEALLDSDAREIYTALSKSFPEKRIILFGESLGTGVALELATHVKPAGVILDSPYYSVVERAHASYPWLPVSLLLQDQFRSDIFIRNVSAPILILHGTQDDLIPLTDSERLAALGKPGQVTSKLYDGQPHVVPLNKGPMPDILEFVAKALAHSDET
jgi:hypothetical protein